MCGLFLNTQRTEILIKLHHAETFRVGNMISENSGSYPSVLLHSTLIHLHLVAHLENVVNENETYVVPAHEIRPQCKRLSNALGLRLHLIEKIKTEL